jgi:hypothetical protein
MKNWKNWTIFILVVVVAILIYLLSGIRNAASDRDKEISILRGDVKHWQDESGKWFSQIEGTEAAYDEVYAELSKIKGELTKAGIKVGNIKSATTMRIYIHDTVRLDPVVIMPYSEELPDEWIDEDGLQLRPEPTEYAYQDEWADIKLTQNIFWWGLEYRVRDSVTLVVEEKHRPIKKDILRITSYSANPNVIVEGIDYLEIKPKEQRMGFGPQFGIGYNGNGFSPYVGVGVQYNLIKF